MRYWYKSELRSEDTGLPVTSPASRFGCGVFETIYYNGVRPCHQREHLDRLYASLDALGIAHEKIDPNPAIDQVTRANGLSGKIARINVIYPVASENEPASPLVLASPHTQRPDKVYALDVCPNPRQTWLAAHKTVSRMELNLDRARARGNGFDDALLLDFEGRILETCGASLLFSKNGVFVTPDSPWQLPGIALGLAGRTVGIKRAPLGLGDLAGFDHAYLLNSMIGARPVGRIAERTFALDEAACAAFTRVILPED